MMVVNTIKIAGTAILSILLAELLRMEFSVSAGIIAILTIQPTKKETIRTAAGRLLAFLSALVIAFGSFRLLGCSLEGFLLYLAIFILLCQLLGWYSSMAMNSVLISHFLTWERMDSAAVINEILLFAIGVGMGVLVNLHLHKDVDYIEELKAATDERIRRILYRMAERILDKEISDYRGECFVDLRASIRKAAGIAEANFNNQFGSSDVYDKEYIHMREEQCQILYEMYKNVRTIKTTPITAGQISGFFREIAGSYDKDNTGRELLVQFKKLEQEMKGLPLPADREEFEDRAKLFALLGSIEEFLLLKLKFMEKYVENGREKNKEGL